VQNCFIANLQGTRNFLGYIAGYIPTTSAQASHVSCEGKLLFKFHPLHFLLAHSVAIKRSFKKKLAKAVKQDKKYGSFGLGLSSPEGNKKKEV
jgi:hypothetical protein